MRIVRPVGLVERVFCHACTIAGATLPPYNSIGTCQLDMSLMRSLPQHAYPVPLQLSQLHGKRRIAVYESGNGRLRQ